MKPIYLLAAVLLVIAPTSGHADAVTQKMLKRGEKVYVRCAACHSPRRNRTGPKHCGLFGRKAGSVPGFRYSKAMAKSNFVWNEETLDAFLKSPMSMLPGTTMGYAGIKSSKNRTALIAFLRSLDDSAEQCR